LKCPWDMQVSLMRFFYLVQYETSGLVLDYQNFWTIRWQIKGILLYLGEKFLFNWAGPYGIRCWMWVHLQLTASCNPGKLLLKAMDDIHPLPARQNYLSFQFVNLTDNRWWLQSAHSSRWLSRVAAVNKHQ
jgi:hypothetical protein